MSTARTKKSIDSSIALPIGSFIILSIVTISLYVSSINSHYSLIRGQVYDTGEFLSKEFKNIVKSDISRLENLKSRLEYTNGDYHKNWEHDAGLLIEQNTSFKFIEWIDSSMIIRKINPLKGNENALNLDISKIEYRKNDWINHTKSGKTNITAWAKLTQPGHAFLVDIPVHFNNKLQGTITAGMDFSAHFDILATHLHDQFIIELYDNENTLFYKTNLTEKLEIREDIIYTNNFIVDAFNNKSWTLKITPSEKLELARDLHTINIALVFGLSLSVIVALLIYFYLKANKNTKLALETNLKLVNTNKKLNEERDRAEKASQAKTEFLSNMSHEIRTPLHAIIGFIQLLKSSKLNKTDQEYIDLMDKSSNNLLNLINDILDLDKIESGNVELDEVLFNPSELAKELIDVNQFLFIKKNLFLKSDFENAQGVNVIGDQNKLIQILNNTLKNALKFTNKGGAYFTYKETVVNNSLKLKITVKDTGIGIPKDKIDSIFTRFTQIDSGLTKEHEGSGLGLAISKNLITMLGGDIQVKSNPNEGSEFKISVSFKIAENQNKLTPTPTDIRNNITLSDLNVLIVDDNNLNIIVLKKLLEGIGIQADTAENGIIALQKIKLKKYQLIFMDVHMPEMDGYEATKLIREDDKDVVILGLSANVTSESKKKATVSGMNNYLSKPIKKESLYKILLLYFNNKNIL
ncbi:response regulator [Flavobacteriaceae bacterium XHP0103]|uniref:response regulator n=1 Tax=Marixanthotalea marina TaxID=2844359 RepID=UPI002989DBE3|nr:response regulator [Marixanthotalea marina]MBU3821779.1 response regulator [Marixanthotalea marina]